MKGEISDNLAKYLHGILDCHGLASRGKKQEDADLCDSLEEVARSLSVDEIHASGLFSGDLYDMRLILTGQYTQQQVLGMQRAELMGVKLEGKQ